MTSTDITNPGAFINPDIGFVDIVGSGGGGVVGDVTAAAAAGRVF